MARASGVGDERIVLGVARQHIAMNRKRATQKAKKDSRTLYNQFMVRWVKARETLERRWCDE
jgi:hypothetical protein